MSILNRELDEAPFKPLFEAAVEHLYRLVGDWRTISDLSQADLLLWLENRYDGFFCAAHCRPATGPTVHLDDVIGFSLPPTRQPSMEETSISGKIVENPAHRWTGMNTVSETLIPIPFQGKLAGAVAIETNLAFQVDEVGGKGWFRPVTRQPHEMMVIGEFPYEIMPTVSNHGNPRVVDGALLSDIEGRVEYASPDAISTSEHLGFLRSLHGEILAEVVTPLVAIGSTVDRTLAVVLMGRALWVTEVKVRGVLTTVRVLPLRRDGKRIGVLLLTYDVIRKRVREKQLLSKNATIREVHCRVKNNLQTVSAVLRLQARRSDNDTVKEASAKAKCRVSVIATIHESLLQIVDGSVAFDEIFGKLLALVATAASEDHLVETKLTGSFGTLGADTAAALGVVLSELVTNAIEHGLEGCSDTVMVNAKRSEDELVVTVTDNDIGTDREFIGGGLGTQIVKALVSTELGGSMRWECRVVPDVRTVVHLVVIRLQQCFKGFDG